ncbi:MAG: hypothetical protein KGH93_03450 [Patescibacteria group bacterium]|nr:hypothetical protein [Patescibacteria group bacterium]MDE1946220.1 hypothetical protein [Patescibacteria group bacterium]
MALKIEVHDEIATQRRPACISIYDGNELVQVIVAEIKQEKGADNGKYGVVKITHIHNIP